MKLTSKELRIGNYVDYGQGRESQQITGHDLYEGVEGRSFRPIQLSEEWLKKFGFHENDKSWINGNSLIAFYDHGDGFSLDTHDGLIGKKFEYVHQLQNLYFAICGEELTLNTESKHP